jgi:hypothetical protein
MTAGILGATLLITATTIDDAVWLIPYCTANHLPTNTKIIHAATFMLTLQLLTMGCIVVSKIFQHFILRWPSTSDNDSSFVFELVGALMCWSIAIFLYVKKMRKKKRQQLKKALEESEKLLAKELIKTSSSPPSEDQTLLPEVGMVDNENRNVTSSTEEVQESSSSSSSSESDVLEGSDIPIEPSIRMVMTLTGLGALDEMSYFPALLVGKVFSPTQLLTGTFVASGLVLIVVLYFLARFKPLVDFLDSIPLYVIVAIFASIMTIGLFF